MKKFLFILAFCSTCIFANTLQQIQKANNIRIGVRLNLPPFSDQDKQTGDFEGFEVQLAQAIGKAIVGPNGTITIIGINAGDRIPMLQNNEIDIAIANFSKTPQRAQVIDFSIPYLSNHRSVLTRKGDGIKSLNDLAGKKMLYVKGTATEAFLKNSNLRFELVECPTVLECFKQLKNNTGDGYIHSNILIAQLTLLDDNIIMPIKSTGDLQYISAGVAKNNKELLESIDNIILTLSKGDFFKDTYNETFEPFFKGTVERKYLLLDDLYRMLQQ